MPSFDGVHLNKNFFGCALLCLREMGRERDPIKRGTIFPVLLITGSVPAKNKVKKWVKSGLFHVI